MSETPDRYQRELARMREREAQRLRRRLVARLVGWVVTLAALAVVAYVSVRS